ncbi:MAG: hypothetical protein ACRC2Y_04900 [Aeromonas veronii]
MGFILLWILCATGVGFVARALKREAAVWFFVSLLVSPIIALVCLMFMGDAPAPETTTETKKTEKKPEPKKKEPAEPRPEQVEYQTVKAEFLSLYEANPAFEKDRTIGNLYDAVVVTPSITHTEAMKAAILTMK